MMDGHVDGRGRALIEICLVSDDDSTPLEVWIDTGFTGQLLVPRDEITAGIVQSIGDSRASGGWIDCVLGDI